MPVTTPPNKPRGPWARLAEWEEEQHALYDDEYEPSDEYTLTEQEEEHDA